MFDTKATRTLDMTDAFPEGYRSVSAPKERQQPVCPIKNGLQAWGWLTTQFRAECREYRLHAGRLERCFLTVVNDEWVDEWKPCSVQAFINDVRHLWRNDNYYDLPTPQKGSARWLTPESGLIYQCGGA